MAGEYIHRKKLEVYKKWKFRKKRRLTLEDAKKLLSEEGYVLIKLTEEMEKRMDLCAEGLDEDCMGCCANVCLL